MLYMTYFQPAVIFGLYSNFVKETSRRQTMSSHIMIKQRTHFSKHFTGAWTEQTASQFGTQTF
jgi:hypothetical protein